MNIKINIKKASFFLTIVSFIPLSCLKHDGRHIKKDFSTSKSLLGLFTLLSTVDIAKGGYIKKDCSYVFERTNSIPVNDTIWQLFPLPANVCLKFYDFFQYLGDSGSYECIKDVNGNPLYIRTFYDDYNCSDYNTLTRDYNLCDEEDELSCPCNDNGCNTYTVIGAECESNGFTGAAINICVDDVLKYENENEPIMTGLKNIFTCNDTGLFVTKYESSDCSGEPSSPTSIIVSNEFAANFSCIGICSKPSYYHKKPIEHTVYHSSHEEEIIFKTSSYKHEEKEEDSHKPWGLFALIAIPFVLFIIWRYWKYTRAKRFVPIPQNLSNLN